MSARNFTSKNPMDDAAYRQVIDEYHDGASCSGSHVSHKIEHSIVSRRSSAVMTVAELIKRQSDLDKQKRLVDLELEMAKLRVELEESNVHSNLKVISAPSSDERNQGIGAFVDQCQLSAAEAYDHRANRGRLVSQQCLQLDLPKVELEYFDGNPAKYWKFVKQFEYYVESRVFDSGQRLLYLIHYCRGYAKEAISECVMLPPSVAYDRARKVLRELFGESHVVARSLIDGLMTGLRPLSANPDELSKLSMKMENCYIALSQMNFTADLNSIATIERVVRVLPSSFQARWARVADSITHDGREVDFKDLADFVAAESRVARSRFGQIASSNASRQHLDARPPLVEHRRNDRSHVLYTWSGASPKTACLNCGSDHATASCRSFLSLDVPSRWRLMKSRGGCFRCLGTGHRSATCQNGKDCNVPDCRGRHHPLLHSESRQVTSPTVANTCTATFTAQQQVCLGVVPVRIESQRGLLETYALLDTGSNVTLVEEGLMEEAGIGVTPSRLEFTTMSGTSSIEAGYVGFTLSSLDGTGSISVRQAYCLPRLPLEPIITPKRDLARQWPHLADIPFEEIRDSRIRILLGTNVPEAHWHLEQRLGERNHPFAVKTLLGWTLLGPVGEGRTAIDSVQYCHISRPTVEEQLERLYNNDFSRVDVGDHAPSVEDNAALSIAQNSVHLVNGHFEIGLPWRNSPVLMPNNYEIAFRRLQCLRKRLITNCPLGERYAAAIEATISKGYAVRVPTNQLESRYAPRWYLTHHAVINPKKPDKLRVVFDCAARYKGLCLNDQLLQGPHSTSSLIGVLMRFRNNRVAVVSDIEEMFMQVKVPENDRGALRFLWWRDSDFELDTLEYQMTAHPFGATSSPFCANFALRRTAEEWGDRYDRSVSDAVMNGFYVDDCLVSLPCVAEAVRFVVQIQELLGKAGFKLRKWVSNSAVVLETLPATEIASPIKYIGEAKQVQRTLGIEWDAVEDAFLFRFAVKDAPKTRRSILSVVSSMYDPLGLVAPSIMPAKILLQKLCRDKLGWDQLIDQTDEVVWENWLTGMRELGTIKVPRCVLGCYQGTQPPQLHIFCDASEKGYGAVAYARFGNSGISIHCCLLYAKSRVAPLKSVSIPRLELTAAKLAIRVFEDVTRGSKINFEKSLFWTDSMVVLYYINNLSTRFSTFIANRLSAIHEVSSPNQWRHVKSEDNPADLLSRGVSSSLRLKQWFSGPEFLWGCELQWPASIKSFPTPDSVEHKRTMAHVLAVSEEPPLHMLIRRYSSWLQLLKSVAWLSRFKMFIRYQLNNGTKQSIPLGLLSLTEISAAERDVVRLVQQRCYAREIKSVSACVGKGARATKLVEGTLKRLCPILHNGILCVGSRLAYSASDSLAKYPMILPAKHALTVTLINFYHLAEGHSGVSQVLSSIRRKYWIVQGASAVKRVIGKCWTCRKRLATAGQQMMSPLPAARVDKGWHPFKHVGIDYFGPILIKHGRKQEKRYGCLFTCLQMRAVHLEVSHSLTTDSFIMCLLRFISRRGTPDEIYSDNGTNFIGAA
ncbi:unnamed protein product, partial [Dicrocoelium dendriticum]